MDKLLLKIIIHSLALTFLVLASVMVLEAFMIFLGMNDLARFVVILFIAFGCVLSFVGSWIEEDD